jgi:hypothetical protein
VGRLGGVVWTSEKLWARAAAHVVGIGLTYDGPDWPLL